MKKLLSGALMGAFLFAAPAMAEDYSNVPAAVMGEIKAKCIAKHPGDYSMQHGCLMNQAESYLAVHGPAPDLAGIPTWVDRAAINNAAYLKVASNQCGINTQYEYLQYRIRAMESGRLKEAAVNKAITAGVIEQTRKAKANKAAFCAEAKKNLPNFAADLLRNPPR